MSSQSHLLATPCSKFEEDLVLLHYGDLGGAERDSLQNHILSCAGCAGYLVDLARLLPLTMKADDPPQTFWSDYNRELRHKLDEAAASKSWWRAISKSFQPRWLPAFATAAVIVLALTFTVGRGIWPTQGPAQEDEAILESLPLAENLEFLKAMDFLDDLELLEFMDRQSNSNV
ncbi:MAG TPA: zf-HC2 domain-containing protein [Candidatus Limnocylindria bacterium]|nr:zf-HC2 domain-containing protein [Candidatus Limnocylindria bacterium]